MSSLACSFLAPPRRSPIRLQVATTLNRLDFFDSPLAHRDALALVLELAVQPAARHAHLEPISSQAEFASDGGQHHNSICVGDRRHLTNVLKSMHTCPGNCTSGRQVRQTCEKGASCRAARTRYPRRVAGGLVEGKRA